MVAICHDSGLEMSSFISLNEMGVSAHKSYHVATKTKKSLVLLASYMTFSQNNTDPLAIH